MSEFDETSQVWCPSAEQEKQNFMLGKFREILDKVPKDYAWVDEEERTVQIEEEIIVVLYEEGGKVLEEIVLQADERRFQVCNDDIRKFGVNDDVLLKPVEKTTSEQLRDMVEKKGNPTNITFVRKFSNIFFIDEPREKDILYAEFPFSEIKKDLGL